MAERSARRDGSGLYLRKTTAAVFTVRQTGKRFDNVPPTRPFLSSISHSIARVETKADFQGDEAKEKGATPR